ncbi:hypothetical protein A2482_00035 [Candidatus Falkowbacteria bacterium RIFOXYC2_FULL_48_21]|uniref:HEPN AbiU2-like domain-containing protein n=1 Tax=Candidatus Falkowbacteria bacterium RIFOXYC2_FULL_48_21 TaxID=1798005 RepID=A0A1F5TB09_9BACT|nr:MAG: hypothetical protein A2482_00035 [Candidatus Falkowbacteria bacterium RIFOXYC2_FULL_48_21]
MSKDKNKKEIADYFRLNIFEAFSAYNTWKMLHCSISRGIVSKEMADRYLETLNYHNDFFQTVKKNSLISFVMLSLHAFDKRDDSFSLYEIDQFELEKFISNNKEVLEKLKMLRHKLFAHRDNEAGSRGCKIVCVKV